MKFNLLLVSFALSFLINSNLFAYSCDVTNDRVSSANYNYMTTNFGSLFADFVAEYHCDYLFGSIDFFNFNDIGREFNFALVRGQGHLHVKQLEKLYSVNCETKQEKIEKTGDLFGATRKEGGRYSISTKCYTFDGVYAGDAQIQLEGYFSGREVLIPARLKVKSAAMNFR